jgi:hypothetical protein
VALDGKVKWTIILERKMLRVALKREFSERPNQELVTVLREDLLWSFQSLDERLP